MKITNHVHMLDCTKGSHAYLILGKETILVDTCVPGRGKQILNEVKTLHINPQEIKHILLTHHDLDHIGNAAMLQKATGAQVWASREDIPYILGQKTRHGIKKYLSLVMKAKKPQPINEYPADNRLGEIEIIPTPGHTPGHVSLLFQDVLFAGDLLATKHGIVNPSPPIMTWDRPLLIESIKKILPLSFNVICPAHGDPVIRGQTLDKFNELTLDY